MMTDEETSLEIRLTTAGYTYSSPDFIQYRCTLLAASASACPPVLLDVS